MRGKKAKMIQRLVKELASPGVNRQVLVGTMKRAFSELTHTQKKRSNLFSERTASDVCTAIKPPRSGN